MYVCVWVYVYACVCMLGMRECVCVCACVCVYRLDQLPTQVFNVFNVTLLCVVIISGWFRLMTLLKGLRKVYTRACMCGCAGGEYGCV